MVFSSPAENDAPPKQHSPERNGLEDRLEAVETDVLLDLDSLFRRLSGGVIGDCGSEENLFGSLNVVDLNEGNVHRDELLDADWRGVSLWRGTFGGVSRLRRGPPPCCCTGSGRHRQLAWRSSNVISTPSLEIPSIETNVFKRMRQ